jgi:hypothetical protein
VGNVRGALFGCCLLAGTVGWLTTCCFGDFLDDEWAYWIPAILIGHARVYASSFETVPSAAGTAGVVHQSYRRERFVRKEVRCPVG